MGAPRPTGLRRRLTCSSRDSRTYFTWVSVISALWFRGILAVSRGAGQTPAKIAKNRQCFQNRNSRQNFRVCKCGKPSKMTGPGVTRENRHVTRAGPKSASRATPVTRVTGGRAHAERARGPGAPSQGLADRSTSARLPQKEERVEGFGLR